MDEKKEFYIGWQNNMPQDNRNFLKKIIILLFIFVPLLALLVVGFQKPFNTHVFELGAIKEFTGIYHEKPVPILEVQLKAVPEGFSNHILLVGYGKFGAEGIMDAIKKEKGDIEGKKITLKGTLIYGDGKTLIELTEKENSLVDIHGQTDVTDNKIEKNLEETQLTGEILDPKCYFGVMKPGEGKIHKSCAIRCISGGIPPIFRVVTDSNTQKFAYYIVLGSDGKKINETILPFVAENIDILGKVSRKNGWNVVYTDPQNITLIH